MLAVLRTLGKDKAMVSGESLGGWVATYLAVHHPAVVEKLVLNTAGGWTAHTPAGHGEAEEPFQPSRVGPFVGTH
jgi:pimeloyl-ACP methyl ester carboxylesterase